MTSRLLQSVLLMSCAVLFSTNTWAKDIWARDKLFGDVGGARSGLANHGVDVDVRLSQFYQDVVSGGVNSDDSGEYGVKLDTWINVDAHKLFNSWEGLFISMHVETRGGYDVLTDAGPATLPNAALLYPLPGDYHGTDITSFMVSQVMFDGKAAAVAGKLGSFDLLQGMFPKGILDYGLDGFQNANSIMSILSWGRWLTLSQYGGGIWTIADGMPSTGVIVTGATNTTTTWSTKGAFSDGVGVLLFHRFLFEIDDKPGYLYIGGGGSFKEYPSLDPHDLANSPKGIVTDSEKNPWGVAAYWYQVLWQAEADKDRRVQTFIGGSVADDNPSFSDWDIFASVQSFGFFDSRQNDRIGLAGHYYHYAEDYRDLVNLIPGENITDNSWTFELFYNFEVNKWLHLTPSIQYVQNENDNDDPALIPGVRLVMDF